MRRSILFVDDEPNILQGLQRLLRPLREEWRMAFANSGAAALKAMEENVFDVVVSDMRMPGMNGAELLTAVRARHPQVVRIILSGQSDREMIMRSVGPAHQFLAKPCDPAVLKGTIQRACALRELLADRNLKQLISQMETLPSLPGLYTQLMEEVNSPDASLQRVGEIIAQDVGMTAKILQLVNSAFFGFGKHVTSPVNAVKLLGIETIKALVLSVHVFSQFEERRLRGLHLESLWNHSHRVGACARLIALNEKAGSRTLEEAFTAGVLHDAGKLILAANVPDLCEEVLQVARDEQIAVYEAEMQVLGATHAEVGAYLVGLWGLPDPIVEALAWHQAPGACPVDRFCPLVAVHVADCFQDRQNTGEDHVPAAKLDTAFLESIGLQERLGEWEDCCRNASEEA